jgi:hypothetical protein
VGSILGERGYVQLSIGQTTKVCFDDEKRVISLPFEVRLDDFKVERIRRLAKL